ncbi:MAG: S-layer homology domain-containing protein, partial [Clostridia bacterium]|nr:S-layer homology domain-containing protein [Clostridia bacterium]
FEPDGLITREQLATMLFRFSSSAPVSVPERADLTPFSDDEKVSEWANEPLEWAVEAGLIKGTDGNRLAPEGDATREQFAAIIERYDGSFKLAYNEPVIRSHYTEKEYPLVTDADVYVATDGDDANPGTFDKPLATFAGAVAKVREIKETKTSGDVVVAFKAGDYGHVELRLGPDDAGSPDRQIVYCAYGDGDVTFDNGVTLKESDFTPLDDGEKALFNSKNADKIKKVDVGARLGTVPEIDEFALFSDKGFCTVARFPNKYPDGSDHFLQAAETYDKDNLLITLGLLAKRLANYDESVIRDMRIYGYIVRGYRKDTFEIEGYDAENSLLRVGKSSSAEFGGRLRDGWRDADGQGIRMIVLNVPYELDAEGEYWLDRSTGVLYVYDPKGDYHVPTSHGEKRIFGLKKYDTGDAGEATETYCAIYAEDTGFITFRKLHFTNNVGIFVMGYKTSGFEIDRCRFDCNNGRDMILFEKSLPDVPLGLRVTDSEFNLCAGRHVFVFDNGSEDDRYTNRSEILVDNCLFSLSNLNFDAEGAVNLHACSGGVVSHNRFENCYRYAVMFTSSCDVIVEYNDFNSAMTNSDDGGVTRGCGDIEGNNVVRYNFYNTISAGSVGHMAHYCDNGDCGTRMYSNLLYFAGSVTYHGSGRDNSLNYNVMIGCGSGMGSQMGQIMEKGLEAAKADDWIIGNILSKYNNLRNRFENVPGYKEEAEKRRPGISSYTTDLSRLGESVFALAPTNEFVGNLFINSDKKVEIGFADNAEEFCTFEGNTACTYADNPVFVNPTRGDYRIREGADFPDIHFEEIGRY